MKKSINVFILIAILSVILPLFSCSDGADLGEPECVIAKINTCIYGDNIFLFEDATVKNYNVNDLENGAVPLYHDALASYTENPLYNILFFAVDPIATAQNEGEPVLIMSKRTFHVDEAEQRMYELTTIFFYNTLTGEIVTVKDDIEESLQSLCLYGDKIIYTTNEGELGYNIHMLDKDGGNYIKMDNPDSALYRVHTVYGDRIYYGTDAGQLYSCSLTFDDAQYICDFVLAITPFVAGGSIVYCDNLDFVEYNATEYQCFDVCRRSFSDLSTAETVIEDIYVGMDCGDNFYYYLCSPRSVSEKNVDRGTNILYKYSFESKQSSVVYDLGDALVTRIYTAISDDYILYDEADYSSGELVSRRVLHNLATGEETVLPEE